MCRVVRRIDGGAAAPGYGPVMGAYRTAGKRIDGDLCFSQPWCEQAHEKRKRHQKEGDRREAGEHA